MKDLLINKLITKCLDLSGHSFGKGFTNLMTDKIDKEHDGTGMYKGNVDLNPIDRIQAHLPNPLDAAHPEVIMYLNACVITMAFNHYKKKYGAIKPEWSKIAIKYRDLVTKLPMIISSKQMTELDTVATADVVKASVWG